MIRLATLALAAATASFPALAQDMSPEEQAHALRQAHMSLYSANLGPLVAMARGDIEYDAEVAELRAGNIAAYSSANILPYFVEGSSSDDLEDSRALPAIWDDMDGLASRHSDLHEAAMGVVEAAPDGQEAFASAFQALGQACGACHEDYRLSED